MLRKLFAIVLVGTCLLTAAKADAEGEVYCGPGTVWDDGSNVCHAIAMPCREGSDDSSRGQEEVGEVNEECVHACFFLHFPLKSHMWEMYSITQPYASRCQQGRDAMYSNPTRIDVFAGFRHLYTT